MLRTLTCLCEREYLPTFVAATFPTHPPIFLKAALSFLRASPSQVPLTLCVVILDT